MDFHSRLEHPFDQIEKPATKLNLLLLSDIHNAIKRLEKLKNWHVEFNKEQLHFVLILGDTDNLNNNDASSKNILPGLLENGVSNVLKFLEFFSVPILYIPGNHDSPTLFTNDSFSLTPYSTNIHLKNYMIAEDLQIVGLGGSLPGYIANQDGIMIQVWESYPYDEKSFEADLNPLIKKFCKKELQTILVTHNGPSISSTTVDISEFHLEQPVQSGSKYLSSVLKNKDLNILANLHGHTHAGCGRTNIASTQIINPGSLMDGNFGMLKLYKDSNEKRWLIQSLELIDLKCF